MPELKTKQSGRRKRRISPERIAIHVREAAANFNAALARAKNEGMEVVTEQDGKQQEIVIKEIRINKSI